MFRGRVHLDRPRVAVDRLEGGLVIATSGMRSRDEPVGSVLRPVWASDEVRKSHGLEDPATWSARRSMSDQTQKRLVTLLAIVLAMGLTRPVDKFIDEQIPERRGVKDDLTEAALQGLVRMAAFFAASLVVRKLAELWR